MVGLFRTKPNKKKYLTNRGGSVYFENPPPNLWPSGVPGKLGK